MCSLRLILTFLVLLQLDVAWLSEYDRENWVDLDDIMNYDRVTKTMVPTEQSR